MAFDYRVVFDCIVMPQFIHSSIERYHSYFGYNENCWQHLCVFVNMLFFLFEEMEGIVMGVIGWQKLFIGHFMTPLLVLKEIIQFPYNRKGPAFLILLLPASRSRIGTPFLSISICNKPAVCSTSLNYVLI